MRITVNNKQSQISESAIQHAMSRIETAFSKLRGEVISVELLVEDVNGPRGGIDKKCQIVVNLRKMASVAVSVEKATFSKAISQTISRARRAASRKVQRRSIRAPRRRCELKFGFQN
jgi:hypothetical protein